MQIVNGVLVLYYKMYLIKFYFTTFCLSLALILVLTSILTRAPVICYLQYEVSHLHRMEFLVVDASKGN